MDASGAHAGHGNDHVGVRELRQNLSVYLRRIERGESFTVTERGNPVARLTAIPVGQTLLERLVAEGKVEPPSPLVDGSVPQPVVLPAGARLTSELVGELREDIV